MPDLDRIDLLACLFTRECSVCLENISVNAKVCPECGNKVEDIDAALQDLLAS